MSEIRGKSDAGDEEGRDQSASEALGAAIGGAARKAGLDPDTDQSTGQIVWQVIGGWRGIVESALPVLAFVVTYSITRHLVLALALSVGAAAVFTLVRLFAKSPPIAALSGLVGAVVAASLPLFTGRPEDQFIVGFITNIVYGVAFLLSAAVRWPLIGVIVGFLTGDGVAWRGDRRKLRTFSWLSIAWSALFLARLTVQLPFYFAADVATLGAIKIAMGVPLFAVLLATTWIVARRLYGGRVIADKSADS